MRLQVRFISGDGFELAVDPSIQVSTLKMKIQEKTKVPIFQQRLMVQNGQSVEMQDDRSLSYYNLNPSPTVLLLVTKEESMQIFLRNDKGKTSTYDVMPSESMQKFKARVHRQEGVRPDQQCLVYEGRQLEDGRLLSDYNIRPQTTVMLVSKEESMQIFLLNDKGKTSTYDVMPSESVQKFKARVHRREGVRPEQQRLVYEGKQLEDGRLLSAYNITPRTTISLLLRLGGGRFTPADG
ncbi:polyubiquitin-like [Mobula hypostoma]|uniref:polyubiquitin-like n=1 Tax=Mobula hypostoma TaxID=723540 RepID=UPI002FC340C1